MHMHSQIYGGCIWKIQVVASVKYGIPKSVKHIVPGRLSACL